MAGHSKFKNIMHRKGAQDAKRARVFTRIIREIVIAARTGLPDPAVNPRLRAAITSAKIENMPKDKIENAIKKGSGEIAGENYEEIRYEGYGANGVAIIVETATDNRNRTAAEVRSVFAKHHGNMGETGSVGFMFAHMGVITYSASKTTGDAMMEAAIEAGAENCESDAESHEITCTMEDFNQVREAMVRLMGDPESAKLQWIAQVKTPIQDEAVALSVLKLIDALDDCDDVQDVFSNMEIDDTIMQKLSA
jgi:YebC/PmpR family DNA-binding regulatory protein